jgi:uncharacterized cupredoxin-like copper-binding protein
LLLKGLLLRLVALAVLAVVALTGSDSASATQTPQVLEVTALEQGTAYLFDKTELRVKPGPVVVRLTNAATSGRPHTFDVKTRDGSGDIVRSERVDPGKTIEVTFTLPDEGSYQFICLLPGHADRGQKGTLIAAAAAAAATPAAGAATTSSGSGSSGGGGGSNDLLLVSLLVHIPAVSIFVGLALWDVFVAHTPAIEQGQRARMIGKTGLLTLALIAAIMITGVYQTIENPFRSIKSYSDLHDLRSDTTYGMALFIKHAFVILTFILSPVLRFYLAPRVSTVSVGSDGTAVASDVRLLQMATLVNLALCIFALLATARMTIELH